MLSRIISVIVFCRGEGSHLIVMICLIPVEYYAYPIFTADMYTRLSHEPSVTHAHTSASAAGSSNVTGSSGDGGSTLTCLNMIVDNIPPQQHGAASVGDDLSPRPQQHLQHQQQNNSSPNSHCSM